MARIRTYLQPIKKSFWKIALYIRLSKEDGNDESLSIGNQRKILLEYIQKSFKEEYEIVDAYIDDGKTGTNINRPDFIRLEQDILTCKVNCVIVKSLARAFRNLGDQQKYLEEFFPIHNTRFIALGIPFIDTYKNSRTTLGLEVPIHGMFNEQFAANTSEEVRKTFNTKRRNGEFIGAFAPYGYKKHPDNKNQLIIDNEASVVVKDIFTWFLYGLEPSNKKNSASMSANGIARELNERGILCPSIYKKQQGLKYRNPHNRFKECHWSGMSVMQILKNRIYTGCMVQGKYRVVSYKIHKQIRTPQNEWFIVENTHNPIIEQKIFNNVQQRLKRDTRTAPGKKELSLFSGILRCADCGYSLHRKTSKNFTYYYCRTNQTNKNACIKPSIRESTLEKIILQVIQMQISLVNNIDHIIEQTNKASKTSKQSSRLNILLKQREIEYAQQIKLSDSLYIDWKNGNITHDQYLRLKSNTSNKIVTLNQIIKKLQADYQGVNSETIFENSYFFEFQKCRNIQTLNHGLLVDLIDTITISQDKKLTIYFKFANPYYCPC